MKGTLLNDKELLYSRSSHQKNPGMFSSRLDSYLVSRRRYSFLRAQRNFWSVFFFTPNQIDKTARRGGKRGNYMKSQKRATIDGTFKLTTKSRKKYP